MPETKRLLILAGDGIGPEVMGEVRRVMDWLAQRRSVAFEVEDDRIGGAAYEAYGDPLTDDTVAKAKAADAVLLGAVGGPQWEDLPFDKRPERGLLRLRKDLGLFANLRPALVFDALAEASTLRAEVVAGLDIMIVRELTGGIYFGDPRGIEALADGTRRGVNTEVYTNTEIQRLARVGFELARSRQGRVCSVDKANVLESSVLWREEVQKLGDAEFPDVELSHMYVDTCAMQLIRNPAQFDVIVTTNLFGDILSDEASMLTGSLGMLPSACLGGARRGGPARRRLRTGPRQRPRHRRQGVGQPIGGAAQLRHGAAPFLRHGGPGRAHRTGDRERARRRPSHRRHYAARQGQGLDLGDGGIGHPRAGQVRGLTGSGPEPLEKSRKRA